MSELLPCPFCGSGKLTRPMDGRMVACDRCRASTGICATKENAEKEWNTRYERTCRNDALKVDQFVCSLCRKWYDIVDMEDDDWGGVPNYCPNCGAKVKEASE